MPRWILALAVPALALAPFMGCSSSSCSGVEVGGVCQTECRDELCSSGEKCVFNACVTVCGSASDCGAGQKCVGGVSDFGTKGSFCQGTITTLMGGEGTACSSSKACATNQGYACIEGACAYTCAVHADCGARGSCTGTATNTEHHPVRTCEADAVPRGKGQYGTSCPNDAPTDCDAASDFVCLGAGPGDIDAYCTKQFCNADTDCPSGSYCATDKSTAKPCAGACPSLALPDGGVPGDSTGRACIGASEVGPGKHYQCGPNWLVSNVCKRRDFCSACTTDADCLGKPNQVCAMDGSGSKICTMLCDPDLGSCPWGAATACKVWDQALGVATCGHRFGSCTGTGKGCEPCVEQTDCPNGFCQEAQFTGERYCVDLGVSCSCDPGTTSTCVGGGCPLTPGALPMTCYGGSDYADTALAGKCLGANADVGAHATRESCWPR